LPETFPGIRFDEQGLCQHCQRAAKAGGRGTQRARLRARFEDLVVQLRDRPGYHALMSWSGGKDSTYTMLLLSQEYGLRMLAFTFDNGFVSPGAMENMRAVADKMGVDHVTIRPRFELLRQLFVASTEAGMYPPRALERASGVCNTCMGLAKGIALRLALEQDIPMMAYGWSPGQIPLASALMRGNRRMLQAMMEASSAPLYEAAGDQVSVYFPEERHWQDAEQMPYNVSPLVFLDFDEELAVRAIQPYGWVRPLDTDPNSSNCLLNGYATLVHTEQMGYHPYAMELAGLVREGYVDREEALARLEEAAPAEIVAAVEARLGGER
jgi:hypothetical protein